jgi:glycosyltransferase involved in cell wall biosynthesis
MRAGQAGSGVSRVALMAGSVLKVLLLAQQLQGEDGTWPLTPLLDRLAHRGVLPQLVHVAKGMVSSDDRRAIEVPQLAKRWWRALAVRSLWADARVSRPDLVHSLDAAMASTALAMAEIAGIPYVQSVNNFSTLETGLRLSRRWCRRVVAACDELAEDLVNDLAVPDWFIAVIPPGVPDPGPESPAIGIKGVPVVGATGSSEDVSGYPLLFHAARLVLDAGHEAEFVIATAERDHVDLRHRAQKLGIGERVTVSDHPTIGPRFWSLLDIYCQPALGPRTGRALLNALVHGVPSSATEVKGMRSLIEHSRTGVLVPPGDPEALQQAIVALLRAPDDARRLGSNARESIRSRFDPEVEADMLAALYREVERTR